jgi:hypothetical protein
VELVFLSELSSGERALKNSIRTSLLFAAFALITAVTAQAQAHEGLAASDDLYKTVAGLDAALFNAYNKCELDKLGAMAADDLEFYHDQSGLSIGRQSLVDGVKNNICGKVQRELVDGTLEVYPLKGYGAVEIGVHRFAHPNGPKPDVKGEAKFVMLWQLKDGSWKLTRVISFDHQSAAK